MIFKNLKMIDKKRLNDHLNNGETEYVMCAANYYNDNIDYNYKPYNIDKGFVICGWRHPSAGESYTAAKKQVNQWNRCIQGFLTTKNRFLNRKEALELVIKTGQHSGKILDGVLTSEDLW